MHRSSLPVRRSTPTENERSEGRERRGVFLNSGERREKVRREAGGSGKGGGEVERAG